MASNVPRILFYANLSEETISNLIKIGKRIKEEYAKHFKRFVYIILVDFDENHKR